MRKTAMALVGIVVMACPAFGMEADSGSRKVFIIAYAPNESTDQSVDARNGLARDLSGVIGREVREIQASDYNAIVEALRGGKADMAYMGALAVALGVERARATPIVMKAPGGDKDKAVYRSALIVNSRNREIKGIEDIRGRTMAFVDPDSTSGNLIPSAEIIKAFPGEALDMDKLHSNGDFFEAVNFSGQHQAGLRAVIRGDVDVAPISDQILASEIANGHIAGDAVRVIHESGAIPAEAMVVGSHIDDATKGKLTRFLTAYDNAEYFKMVIKKPDARFVECDVSDYQPIIELHRALNRE